MKVRMSGGGGGQTREGTKGDEGRVNVKQGDKGERFIDIDRGELFPRSSGNLVLHCKARLCSNVSAMEKGLAAHLLFRYRGKNPLWFALICVVCIWEMPTTEKGNSC